jgi:hypothetical protein
MRSRRPAAQLAVARARWPAYDRHSPAALAAPPRPAARAPPPRPGRNLGLGLGLGWELLRPPRLKAHPSIASRSSPSDGQAPISEDQNAQAAAISQTLEHSFLSLPFFTSPQQWAAAVAARDGEPVKRPSLGRPEEVAAPPHGSLPACALARAERATVKWPCSGALSPCAHTRNGGGRASSRAPVKTPSGFLTRATAVRETG